MPFSRRGIRRGIVLILVVFLLINVSITGSSFINSGSELNTQDNLVKSNSSVGDEVQWACFGYNKFHTHLSPYNSSNVDGTLKWSYDAGSLIAYSSPSIDSDGNIYVGTSNNNLYSIEADGDLAWSFNAGDEPYEAIYSTPAIHNQNVYFGSRNGNLYSLDLNGNLNWKFSTGGAVDSSPTITSDGTIIVGSGDNKIYAVNPDGTAKWNYSTEGWVRSSATISRNGIIYVGSYDGNFYALYPNGTLNWKYSSGDGIFSSPAICQDGKIYVGSWDGNFYSFHANGSLNWKYNIGYKIFSSPALGPDSSVLVGAYDGYLYSFDLDGSLNWRYSTDDKISSSPAVDSEGNIYFGSEDQYVYGLNNKGELRWKYKTGNTITSSPSIAKDGMVYIASHDHKIYAFTGTPSAPQNVKAESHLKRVKLSWDEPKQGGGNEIIKYNIYRGTSSSSLSFLTSVDSSIMQYNDNDVVNGETYYYKISAESKYAEGDKSDIVNATPHNEPPNSPIDFTASQFESNVLLNWSKPTYVGGSEITNYNIYRGKTENNISLMNSVDNNDTDYLDDSIDKGVPYYYYVTAVNDVGESDPSDIENLQVTTKPSRPTSLKANIVDYDISLNWSEPTDDGGLQILYFNVYRGDSEGNLNLYSSSDPTEFIDTNIEFGTDHHYYVTAVNDLGESEPSDIVNKTVKKEPSSPSDLSVTAVDVYLNLNWSAPNEDGGSPITNYYIYRGENETDLSIITSVEGNITQFEDKSVEKGEKYFYYVTAVNNIGESGPSNIVNEAVKEEPSPPLNLSTSTTDESIELDWSPSEDDGGSEITNYKIYRGLSKDNILLYTSVDGETTYFSDNSIVKGTKYYYYVTAVNSIGESISSNTVGEEVTTVPSSPTDFNLIEEQTYAYLNWTEPIDDGGLNISGYKIYRGESKDSISLFVSVDSNITEYLDDSIEKGVRYYYYITAVNEVGESNRTEVKSIRITTKPSSPTNLEASQDGDNVSLIWDSPSDDGGLDINYKIYRGTSKDNLSLCVSVDSNKYVDSNIQKGVRYYYYVIAVNDVGESEPTKVVDEEVTTVPSPPEALKVNEENLNISLNWSRPVDDGGREITKYVIYKGESENNLNFFTGVNSTDYLDTDIEKGVNYHYQITAVNSVGESDPSIIKNIKITTKPSSPTNFEAVQQDNNISLSWDPPVDDGGLDKLNYKIYKGQSENNISLFTTIDKLYYLDTEIQKGEAYFYYVTAVNDVGESTPSSTDRSEVTTIPSPPQNLTVAEEQLNISLNWNKPADDGGREITKYVIYRGETEHNLNFHDSVNSTDYLDTNIEKGINYNYYVTAMNDVGESNPSNIESIEITTAPSSPTNLEASQDGDNVSLIWDPPSDDGGLDVHYELYRGISKDNLSLYVSVDTNEYIDSNIQKGIRYYYYVKAVNDVGKSEPTMVVDEEVTTVPSPPKNLTVIEEQLDVSLNWSEPTDDGGIEITKYVIYRGQSENDLSFFIEVNLTYYLDTDIEKGVKYHYQITAVNSVGESDPSKTGGIKVTTKPSSPTNFEALQQDNNVSLSWDPPVDDGGLDILHYKIYKCSSENNISFLTTVDKLSHLDTEIQKGKTYFYYVTAVNDQGESTPSSTDWSEVTTVPSPPRNLSMIEEQLEVYLNWSEPADDGGREITKYKIYRGESENNLSFYIQLNSTDYLDTNIEKGIDYHYHVTAVNEVGESDPSFTQNIKITTKPSSPSDLTASENGTDVYLDWNPPFDDGGLGIISYTIYRAGDENNISYYSKTNNTQFSDANIELGKKYYYYVTAINDKGESGPSNIVNKTVEIKPSSPLNLSASTTKDSIELNWEKPDEDGGNSIYEYRIYRGNDTNRMTLLTDVDSTTLNYKDDSIQKGITYYYYVTAVNGVGESDTSNFVNKEVITSPSNPIDFTVQQSQDNVDLDWTKPSDDGGRDITAYNIYKGESKDDIVFYCEVNSTEYLDEGIEKGVRYYYYVTAVSEVGESEPSSTENIKVTTRPSSPNNLQVEEGDSNISLTWKKPSDDGGLNISIYNVYRGTSQDNIGLYLTLNCTEYVDFNIQKGVSYHYYVTAVNDVGESDTSSVVSSEVTTKPSSPNNLNVDEDGSSIYLTWDRPSDDGGLEISQYNIYRGTSDDDINFYSDVNSTEFIDKDFQKGVVYYYYITATNNEGESDASDTVNIEVITEPSSPEKFEVIEDQIDASLDWTQPSDDGGRAITHYNVYRGKDKDTKSLLVKVDSNNTDHLDDSIVKGATYYYHVTAVNDVGESSPSNTESIKITTKPTSPTNFNASEENNDILLSWDQPPDDGGLQISYYNLYRGKSESDLTIYESVNSTIFTDGNIDLGNTYYYYVTAVNDVGESDSSTIVNKIVTTVPSSPNNLKASANQNNISLDWDGPSEDGGLQISSYNIYRGKSKDDIDFYHEVSSTSYIDSNVEADVDYYYYITAVNDDGESQPSNTVQSSVISLPTTPQNIEAEGGNSTINLSWTQPDDDGGSQIEKYKIYRGQNKNKLQYLTDVNGGTTKYSDNSVENGNWYYYKVSAVNKAGEGPKSNLTKAKLSGSHGPNDKVPTAPRRLQAEPGNGTVNLTWSPPADDGGSEITKYKIYRGKKNNQLELIKTVPGNVTHYNDTSVQNENTYYYRVSAVNNAGEGPKSNVVKARPSWRYAPGMELIPLMITLFSVAIYVYIKKRRE